MIRFDWGDVRLSVLDAGSLRLDGGAMFGIVPRPLWERQRSPDEKNRIALAMNVLLIESAAGRTLVDTGAGTEWADKERSIYALEPKTPEEILAPAGLTPNDVDRVVNSHLHFDHAGGNTVGSGDDLRPAYPNAEYVVQRGELETARWQDERTRGSYRTSAFEPIDAAGRFRLVEGDVALDENLHLEVTPGHTPFMQIVRVVSGPGTVAFLADLAPTTSHVPYPYIMGYDLEPLRTLRSKKSVFPRAAREGWRLVFEHDAEQPISEIAEVEGRLVVRPVEIEA